MVTYSVFGSRFGSELDFEDLDVVQAGQADRVLHVSPAPAPDRAGMTQLGFDDVMAGVQVRLFRHAVGLRLVFDDTGVFDVVEGGRTMIWYREPSASLPAVRLDVLGRVLPLSLHVQGTGTLHGSAVQLGGSAVAFLGPKHHGKSTLARALTESGAELLSDDAVSVHPGPPPIMVPGVRRFRLWSDAALRFGALGECQVREPGAKHLLPPPSEAQNPNAPVSLSAIYVLEPVAPGEQVAAVRRLPTQAVEATVLLIAQMKLGTLLGATETAPVLRFCAAVASHVPVCRLRVVRDFDRLDEVVAQFRAWHDFADRVPT